MDINGIVSMVLMIALAVIVVLTILGLLAGFIKGLIKTSVKTLIKIGLVVIFVFACPAIAKGVGSIDFSRFGLAFEINGTMITFTSILETLANAITATNLISPMNGISIYSTAMALATSITSYVVFLVLMILAQILISLITAIIYNVFLRWLLPIKTRKMVKAEKATFSSKKARSITNNLLDKDNKVSTKYYFGIHRLTGGILGAAQELVFSLTLLVPVTALARTAISNTKDNTYGEYNQITNSTNYGTLYDILKTVGFVDGTVTTEQYDQLIKTIESSPVYTALGFFNFDTSLMEKASSTSLNGTNVSFASLLNSTLNIAAPILDSDILSYEGSISNITINYSTLLSVDMVQTIITSIINNKAIMALIPPLIDVAINYASANIDIPLSRLDFSSVDWSSDLSAIKGIYSVIYNSGLITSMISSDGSLKPESFKLNTSTMTDDQITEIAGSVSSLGTLDSVSKNISTIFAGLGNLLAKQGYDILPTDSNAYSKVNWGDDLSNIVSSVLKLLRLLNLDLSSDLANLNFDITNPENQLGVTLKSVLKDKDSRAYIKNLLLDDDSGLLTLDFIDVLKIGNGINSALSSIPALHNYLSLQSYQSAIASLNHSIDEEAAETTAINTKILSEFTRMFDLADILLDTESTINYWNLKDLISSKDPDQVFSFINDDVCNELVNILRKVKESEIFTSMYPSILKTFLFDFYDSSSIDTKYFMGLTPYNFNYDSETFTEDIKTVIQMAPKLKNLYTNLTSTKLNAKEKIDSIDSETIGSFLSLVSSSDFFNGEMTSSVSGQTIKNQNIHTILSSFFKIDLLADLDISIPTVAEMSSLKWDGTDGEIAKLVSIIDDIKANSATVSDLYHMLKKGEISISSLTKILKESDKSAIVDLVQDVNDSTILRTSLLSVMDSQVTKYLDELGIPFDINALRTFIYNPESLNKINEDLELFSSLLPLIDHLNFHELKLDLNALKSLDKTRKFYFTTIDSDIINALLTSMLQSNTFQMISTIDNDLLSSLFYTVGDKIGLFTTFGFTDYGSDVFNPASYSTSWSSSTTKVTIEGFTDSYSITTSGALASFMTVFDVLKEVDISTILNKKIPSLPSGLDGWLSSEAAKNLFEDSYIRSLTYTYLPDLVELGLDKVSSIPSFASDLVDYCDFSFLIKKNSNGSYVYDSATITKELSVYYHLLSQVKKIGLSNLKSMAKRITALTDKELECLDTIIDLVGDSFVLTDIKPGKDMSPMAKGLSVVLDKVNGTSNDILSMMTISDSETESKNILKAMLISLDTNNLWSEELGRFATILHKMQGMDYKSTDLFAAGRNYDSMSGLLSSMNESILMHKAPIYLFKTAFNSISGLTDLLENNGLLTHPLDFDTHTTASDEDVAYWAHDYELLLSLVYKEDTFAKIIKDKLDLSSMDFGSDGISTSILYYIGSMNLFKYNRSYFLYNLISNYKDSEGEPIYSTIFKNSSSTPYGEDASAYRIEDLLFSNPELLDNDGYIDQEKMLAETDMIDKLINNVLTKALTLQQVTSIEEVYNALKNEDGSFSFFEDLTEMTLRLDTDENDVTSLYRSAFCSELVAGCMNIVTKNESLAQYLGIFSTLDFYANDYALINPIEGKTLDASIILGYELSNGENLGTIDNATLRLPYDNEGIKGYYDIPVASMIYFTDEAIVSLFRRLQATSDDSEIIQFIAANDPNYAVCNSKLAYIMATAKKADNIVKYSFTNPFTQQVIELTFGPYSTLGYLPVLISNSTVGYLGDVLDFNNLNSKTFLELINLDN